MSDEALNYRRSTVGLPPVGRVSGQFSATLAAIRALPETSGRDHESPREDVAYWAMRLAREISNLPTYRGDR